MKKSTRKLLIYLAIDLIAIISHLFYFQHLFFYFLSFVVVVFLPIQLYIFKLDRIYEKQVEEHQQLSKKLQEMFDKTRKDREEKETLKSRSVLGPPS